MDLWASKHTRPQRSNVDKKNGRKHHYWPTLEYEYIQRPHNQTNSHVLWLATSTVLVQNMKNVHTHAPQVCLQCWKQTQCAFKMSYLSGWSLYSYSSTAVRDDPSFQVEGTGVILKLQSNDLCDPHWVCEFTDMQDIHQFARTDHFRQRDFFRLVQPVKGMSAFVTLQPQAFMTRIYQNDSNKTAILLRNNSGRLHEWADPNTNQLEKHFYPFHALDVPTASKTNLHVRQTYNWMLFLHKWAFVAFSCLWIMIL